MQRSDKPLNVTLLSGGVSNEAGGIGVVVCELARAFENLGIRHTVVTIERGGKPVIDLANLQVVSSVGLGRWRVPKGVGKELRALKEIDVIHNHGLWNFVGFFAGRESIRRNVPLLISPHGMLDDWALRRSARKKWVAKLVYERRHLTRAACFHALCKAEADSIRSFGITARIEVIPNGVDLSVNDSLDGPPPWDSVVPLGAKVVLFLSRIDEKKNVRALILAWKEFAKTDRNNEYHLVVIGWGSSEYIQSLKEIARSERIPRLHFLGPLYGRDKHLAFMHSDCYILPSFSEGLPMTVLEAWSQRLPVVMTKECNFENAFKEHRAIETGVDVSDIFESLIRFSKLSADEARQIGDNAYEEVAQNYSWTKIARQYRELYEDLLR